MELLQLRYFCHAAQSENFSQTAKKFHVPQPNISQSMKRLEEELDVSLFTRTANRVMLNEYGKAFYENIELAMQLIDEAIRGISKTMDKNEIWIAAPMHHQAVVRAVLEFQKENPDVRIMMPYFRVGDSMEKFDFIVMDDSLHSEEFTRKKVLRDRLVLVTAKDSLSEEEKRALPDSMKNFTFVTHHKWSFMYKYVVLTCRKLGFEPKIITPAPSEQASFFVPSHLERKNAVALVPSRTKWIRSIYNHFDIFDIGDYYRETYIYRRKSRQKQPHMEQIYDCLLNVFNSSKESAD